jgi:hypothetical protein
MKPLILSILPIGMINTAFFSWNNKPDKTSEVKEVSPPIITWLSYDHNLNNHISPERLPKISEAGESRIEQEEPCKYNVNDESQLILSDSEEYFDCSGNLWQSNNFFEEDQKSNPNNNFREENQKSTQS